MKQQNRFLVAVAALVLTAVFFAACSAASTETQANIANRGNSATISNSNSTSNNAR